MAIPVYMFAGFLESGKTSFIASVLQDPGFTRDENTLIIQCEEGETEYEPDMLKKTHSVVECIEDEDEYNGDTLRAFVRKHHPDRVIIEMNGMWNLDAAIERTPKVLEIYQIITTVNAETFDLYAKNMGQRMLQHITDADMVVFNRATEETRQLIRDRNVRSMNPQASLYFENDDGTSEDYGAGMPPPYDMDAPIVEVEDHQFGIFEVLRFGILAEKLFLQELENFHDLLVRILSAVEQFEVFECLFLQGHEYAGNQFFISNGVGFQFIGYYVVDILDEDNISVEIVQVLDQCTVPTRTEQEFTIVSERLVVHIGSDGVGIWFLFGEGDVIVYSVTFAECFGFLFHQFLEEFAMFGRDSEVYVDFTTFSGCIHSAFGKMFFQWST